MTAFYNELDPFPAKWLENLVAAGHLPAGEVSRTPIQNLHSMAPNATSHFFAGIGGWPLALRMAGFPDEFPVWTGSCPCQPFSQSGKKNGFSDERHLWPAWFNLIAKRKPPVIFGEQVASPDGLRWLDLVSDDLEGAGYTVGAADLCAAGAGAPHIRQRLYFVAYSHGEGLESLRRLRGELGLAARGDDADGCGSGELADAAVSGREPSDGVFLASDRRADELGRLRANSSLGNADEPRSQVRDRAQPAGEPAGGSGPHSGLGDARRAGSGRSAGEVSPAQEGRGRQRLACGDFTDEPEERSGAPAGFWGNYDWIPCRDPKRGVVYRPIEPGTFPLAHGIPGRVGRLRGYGNAILPELAAQFALAILEAVD